MKNYWLVKSEPDTYSWDDFVKKGRDHWDGIRNYQARNNLKAMKINDDVLFYHSIKEKSVVGIAKVVREFYPDPTIDDDRWVVVDLVPSKPLDNPVSLDRIKLDKILSSMVLVKHSRLSVQPVTTQEFKRVLELSRSSEN